MSPTLTVHNTLTRTKEAFKPLNANAVRMYVCGPTVYDFAHIGNARPAIVFDVLFRLLRQLYGESHVIYARNITDVDDKINARAKRDFPDLPLNESINRVTELTERQYREDVAALGCLPPTHEPRATENIESMKALIERLVARGVAYVAEDHVLFSPAAMNALPEAPRYGSLARRSLDEMLAGGAGRRRSLQARPDGFRAVEALEGRTNPAGPVRAGSASLGRPGWHIECSAMAMKTLLEPFGGGLYCDDPERNVFDIHGGGIDLVFPHHENEIAQSCCAFDAPQMANDLDAQRLPAGRGREDVQEPRQLRDDPRVAGERQVRRSRLGRRDAANGDAENPLSAADRLDGSRSSGKRARARAFLRRSRSRADTAAGPSPSDALLGRALRRSQHADARSPICISFRPRRDRAAQCRGAAKG